MNSLMRLPLAELATNIVDGPFGSNLKTSDYVPCGVPVLQGKNITNNRLVWSDIRYISAEKAEELKRSKVFVGDHLLIKIGSIGYSAIVDDLRGHDAAIIPANMVKISPNLELVDSNYLHYWLVSDEATRYFRRVASKTAQPALSLTKIRELEVPYFPLPKQRHISAILDKADTLRAKRQQAMAKLDQLLQSAFLDSFGNPVANPKGWPTDQLGELGKVQTGTTPPSSEEGMFNGPVPFVTPGDLGGSIAASRRSLTIAGARKSRLAPAGSVLVCCIGTIGKMGYAERECAFNQQINAVTWGRRINPKYGYYALRFFAEYIASQGSSTTVPIIKKSAFERLVFPVPPMDFQGRFERLALLAERQKHHATLSLDKLDEFFFALQQKCFSGNL